MLVQRYPRRVKIAYERKLYVHPEIDALTNGEDPGKGFPHVKSEALMDRYVAGHLLGVSLRGTSSEQTDLERLEGIDEIWAFCVRKPRPGWRIFGRFIARDCFIGLIAYDRNRLGKRDAYEALALEVIPAWERLFPNQEPHRGEKVEDYIGGVWRDIDEQE